MYCPTSFRKIQQTKKLTSKMPLFLSLVIFLFLIFQKKRCCFPPVTMQLSSNGLKVPTITSSISVCCCNKYYKWIVSREILGLFLLRQITIINFFVRRNHRSSKVTDGDLWLKGILSVLRKWYWVHINNPLTSTTNGSIGFLQIEPLCDY